MSLSPKVSVIVRAYNPNKWIFEAIESVMDQDYEGEIEIVLCYDKASYTDDILYRLRNMRSRPGRVLRLFEHEHTSPTRALLEYGFRVTTGDYIMILDYDNKMPRNYVRKVITKIKDANFICTNPMLMSEDGTLLNIRAHEKVHKRIDVSHLANYNICDSNGIVLSRRAVNELLKLYDRYLKNSRLTDLVHEDYYIAMVCSKLFGARYIDEIYTYYRVHSRHQTYVAKPSSDIDKMCEILLRDIITFYAVLKSINNRLSWFEKLSILSRAIERLLFILYFKSNALLSEMAISIAILRLILKYLRKKISLRFLLSLIHI